MRNQQLEKLKVHLTKFSNDIKLSLGHMQNRQRESSLMVRIHAIFTDCIKESECVKFVLTIISLEINIFVCVKETLTRAL